MKPIHYLWSSLILVATCGVSPVKSQITATPDGTGTVIIINNNQFDISGGKQAGSNLFHSFDQFGLSQGQTANFQSNPSISNILGRVVGGNASVINGLIQVSGANSNLYLVNPAGIIFGPNASLNVPGSFTATTATGIQVGDYWFKAIGSNNYADLIGTPNAFAFTDSHPGAIINAGNLAVPQGNNITLLGGTVINTGTLKAPGGNITIAAVKGEQLVRITPQGSLLSLDLPVAVKTSLNADRQGFIPLSLPQLLTGGNLTHATGVEVTGDGRVRLTHSETEIPQQAGTVIASGILDASGTTGGNVQVLGDRVGVISGKIDVSGINGGGVALIGGDYQGKGTIPNATRTYISQDSIINADALVNGDGGKVITWANNTTRFDGNITARGGTESGNGGLVEVSGKKNLSFRGNVDVSAVNGQSGSIFLDPENIIIGNSSNATISETTLENTTGNITLEASDNITIEDLASNILEFKAPLTTSITFTAGGNFAMNPNDTIFAPGKVVTITAKNIVAGNINTADKALPLSETTQKPDDFVTGGEINLTATNGDINAGRLSATNNINLNAQQNQLIIFGSQGNVFIAADRGDIIAKGIEIIFVVDFNPNKPPLAANVSNSGLTVNATGLFRVTDVISRNIENSKTGQAQGSIILFDGVPQSVNDQLIEADADSFTRVGLNAFQMPKLSITHGGQQVQLSDTLLIQGGGGSFGFVSGTGNNQVMIPTGISGTTGAISSFVRFIDPPNQGGGMVMFTTNTSLASGGVPGTRNPNPNPNPNNNPNVSNAQQLQGTSTVCDPNDTENNATISQKPVEEPNQPTTDKKVGESTEGSGRCQIPTTPPRSPLQIEGY